MKTKLVTLALIGSLLSAPAFAWGDREQGALTGIAGILLFQQLARPQVVTPYPGQYPNYPVPYIFVPQCRQVLSIQYDRFGNEYRYPVTVCGQ